MIHQAELIVGVGIPGPVDLDRAGGLAGGGVAQVRRDAAILSLELLDGVEGRVAGEEGYGRVQSPAGKQHQWESGPGLLIADANGAFFVERASSCFDRLLSKYAWHRGHRRCRGPGFQYVASCRIIHIRVLPEMTGRVTLHCATREDKSSLATTLGPAQSRWCRMRPICRRT